MCLERVWDVLCGLWADTGDGSDKEEEKYA